MDGPNKLDNSSGNELICGRFRLKPLIAKSTERFSYYDGFPKLEKNRKANKVRKIKKKGCMSLQDYIASLPDEPTSQDASRHINIPLMKMYEDYEKRRESLQYNIKVLYPQSLNETGQTSDCVKHCGCQRWNKVGLIEKSIDHPSAEQSFLPTVTEMEPYNSNKNTESKEKATEPPDIWFLEEPIFAEEDIPSILPNITITNSDIEELTSDFSKFDCREDSFAELPSDTIPPYLYSSFFCQTPYTNIHCYTQRFEKVPPGFLTKPKPPPYFFEGHPRVRFIHDLNQHTNPEFNEDLFPDAGAFENGNDGAPIMDDCIPLTGHNYASYLEYCSFEVTDGGNEDFDNIPIAADFIPEHLFNCPLLKESTGDGQINFIFP